MLFVCYPDLATYERTSVVQRGLINFSRDDLWGDAVSFFLPASSSLERTHEVGLFALCPLQDIGV